MNEFVECVALSWKFSVSIRFFLKAIARHYCRFERNTNGHCFFTEQKRTNWCHFPIKNDSSKEIYRFLFGVPVQSSNKRRLLFLHVNIYKYCVKLFLFQYNRFRSQIEMYFYLQKKMLKKYTQFSIVDLRKNASFQGLE